MKNIFFILMLIFSTVTFAQTTTKGNIIPISQSDTVKVPCTVQITVPDTSYKYNFDTVQKPLLINGKLTERPRAEINPRIGKYQWYIKFDTVYTPVYILFSIDTSFSSHYDITKGWCDSIIPKVIISQPTSVGYFNYGRTTLKNVQTLFPDLKGANISTDLSEIWITPEMWNWTSLDEELAACKTGGIKAGIQIFTGPSVPDFFYLAPYNIAKVNTKKPTGTNSAFQETLYPDYMNPIYMKLMDTAYRKIKQHIIDAGYGDIVVYWNMAEGSTGDIKPYKADPLDPKYNISDDQWKTFRYKLWALIKSISPWPIIFNVGNDYSDLDYVMKNYPNDGIKEGNGGHTPIDYDGSKVTATIKKPWSRTETDGSMMQRYSSYDQRTNAALPMKSMGLGIDIFCTSINDGNIISMRLFNKYTVGTGGISYIHDAIDVADTIRFPVAKYGVVVNPVTLVNYNAQIKLLPNNANGQFLKSQLLAKNINPARQKAIEAFMAPQGALNIPDSLNKDDYGVDLLAGPYERRLHLVNPDAQQSYWRVGNRTDSYGQWAKTFKNAMFVAENPFTTVTVTYYDESGTITIGNTTITGGNTKKFVIKDIKVTGTSFTINSTLKVVILETN